MSSSSLSILVIDENRVRAAIIEAGLREAGHDNVIVIHDVSRVARQIADIAPDVIFIDLGNPNRDMLENMFALSRSIPRPIVMFVDESDRHEIEAAIDAGVSAYIVNDLRKERVKPILELAISRFNAFARLTRDLEVARGELADRTAIDTAKGLLMRSRQLSEDDAYHLLRKTAMAQSRTISEVARSLVTAANLLTPPPASRDKLP